MSYSSIDSTTNSYSHIIKVMSIFGGVQVLLVVIGIIKSKFIAVYIGPSGVGELALFTSAISIIFLVSSFGFGYSATRQIAIEHKENRVHEIRIILSIVTKWLLVLSILTSIIIILLSSRISNMIFGNLSKTIQFMFLSIAIIFMVFKGRNDFFLQGMGHYSKLAKSKSFGALFGLIVSMPIYYYLGIEAIPIVIVLGAIIMYMTSTYYFKKLNLQRVKINSKQTFQRGIEMAKLGLVMVGGQIFGAIVINSINIFISSSGSVSDLGLYNAGISITTGYVGMIFTAMSVELLPRLSSVSYDNKQISSMVNQQSEILLIVLLPLLVIMIYLAPLMIKILLTDEFSNITLFIRIMALTLIIRVPAFTIGYIPIAKGEKRIFFIYNSFLPGIFAMIFFFF